LEIHKEEDQISKINHQVKEETSKTMECKIEMDQAVSNKEDHKVKTTDHINKTTNKEDHPANSKTNQTNNNKINQKF
jgi:hypothetical protein